MVTALPPQGDLWWVEAGDKRRPVLVVTRSDAVPVLTCILVAPVTRTVRGIPTEVPLGRANGLREDCVATFSNLQPIRRTYLTERIGHLEPHQAEGICSALDALADC